jgi:PadR family transcriptional regulator PadR
MTKKRYASLSLRQEWSAVADAMDVMQGTLDLLILKALSLGPVHAWGVSALVEKLSGGVFRIGQGSLYPAVHRFENRGWVTSYWRTTENNRIARYYQLSAAGRHALAQEIERWRSYRNAMDRVIDAS